MADITPAMIKELREMTQAGLLDCKKALVESDGDMEKASEFLRKKGLAAASKRAGREASEGIIVVKRSDDMKKGSIAELNCETDFVAKNDDFGKLAAKVVDGIYEGAVASSAEVPAELDTMVKESVGTVGENLEIGKFESYDVSGAASGAVSTYVHSNGKIGCMVAVTCDKADADVAVLDELGKELAMQAAAAFPQYLQSSEIPEDVKTKEKEIYKDQMKDSGKPDHILDKIVEGKLGKFYSEVCLIDQVYIKDSGKKITDLVKEYGAKLGATITVENFIRIQIGG